MDHDLEKIRRLIAKYYGVKRIEEKDGDVYVHVEDIDYYPEEYFSLLESDLRNIGLIAFTRNPDEIVIIQEHNASRRFSLKMLMALITLATLLYVGYGYVSSYFAANSIYAMYLTLLTFVIPVSQYSDPGKQEGTLQCAVTIWSIPFQFLFQTQLEWVLWARSMHQLCHTQTRNR